MKRRTLLIVAGPTLLALVANTGWSRGWWGNSETGRKHRVYDEELQEGTLAATDLEADRDRMWRTVPSVGYPPSNFEVSPVSAINAASRVFATVRLEGKTADEVASALAARERPRYGYNFPFWPTEKEVVVYRFDCGSFGWQFDVQFDVRGLVTSVERKWIQ